MTTFSLGHWADAAARSITSNSRSTSLNATRFGLTLRNVPPAAVYRISRRFLHQQRTPELHGHVRASDELVGELEGADVVVIGLPMYSFGVPSTLQAWIDHVARAGKAFKYTANDPVACWHRPTSLFAARSGIYKGTGEDTQSVYVTTFLNFAEIRNIEFVYSEGLALEGASEYIDRIAA